MKTNEFLEFISIISSLDHHQRSILTQELNQLADEPKVHELKLYLIKSTNARITLTLRVIDMA